RIEPQVGNAGVELKRDGPGGAERHFDLLRLTRTGAGTGTGTLPDEQQQQPHDYRGHDDDQAIAALGDEVGADGDEGNRPELQEREEVAEDTPQPTEVEEQHQYPEADKDERQGAVRAAVVAHTFASASSAA